MTTRTQVGAMDPDNVDEALVAMATGELDLLDELARCRNLRDCLDAEMRRIVALGRMLAPRPYTLADLGSATGLSVSGVRTYPSQEDVERVRGVFAAAGRPRRLTRMDEGVPG